MSESTTKPKLLRRFLQFRLVTLLVLMVVVGFGSMWVAATLDDRPIDWVPYSKASLEEAFEDDKTVMLYFGADWDLLNSLTEATTMKSARIRRLLRYRDVVAMKADLTNSNPEATEVLRAIGTGYPGPVAAIYTPGTTDKPISLVNFSEADLYKALKTATNRW